MYTYPDAVIWSAAQVISEDDTLTHLPLPRASCIEGVKNALNRLIAAKIVDRFVHAGHGSCTLTRYAVALVKPAQAGASTMPQSADRMKPDGVFESYAAAKAAML